MTRRRRAGAVLAVWAVLGLLLGSLAPTAAAAPSTTPPAPEACPDRPGSASGEVPVLAHFYIWFTSSSWYRAKIDYPTVGRYSSNQTSVMRTQVTQALEAGIDGFIVSWKSTQELNHRLAALRGIAAEEDFKLAITYQAQDFERRPLPVDQVKRDLEELAATYAYDPVFHVLGPRPVVALSGTWHYSEEELRAITEPVASRLLVLATEKNVEGYARVAPAVEGDLYYWSSGNPENFDGYQQKLVTMANAVREHCGVWVAPVTPGFDARAVGGRRVVDRRDGETLQQSWEAAVATDPDAIGVISWNEFSENTQIEPSTTHGTRYLDVLRELTGAPAPLGGDLDSSEPEGAGSSGRAAVVVGTAVGAVILVTLLGVWRRRRLDRH